MSNEQLRVERPYSSSGYSSYGSDKSPLAAFFLTLFLGPLGMFYSTVIGAIIMIVVCVIILILFSWLWIFVTWPINIIWAVVAAVTD